MICTTLLATIATVMLSNLLEQIVVLFGGEAETFPVIHRNVHMLVT